VAGLKTFRLGDADFLLHLCLHLSPHKLGLRELMDIFNFVRAFKEPSAAMTEFVKLVKEVGAEEDVYRALSFVRVFDQNIFYNEVLEALDSLVASSYKKTVQMRVDEPEAFIYTRTVHISRLEKTYALFSMAEHPAEKLKWLGEMWSHLLFPPVTDAFRLDFQIPTTSRWGALKARVKAPYRISAALAEDMGWGIFFLLMARHHWHVLRRLARYVFTARTRAPRSLRSLEMLAAIE
jgi:hypothetical protein